MFKRLSAIVLAVFMLCTFSVNVMAASPSEIDLNAVFEEAKAAYEFSVGGKARSSGEIQAPYYEETELEDGTVLIVEGYPTDYSCDTTELEAGQMETNMVYSIKSVENKRNAMEVEKSWGIFSSTLKFQVDTSNNKKRIDSFSYVVDPETGYDLEEVEIYYYSFDATSNSSAYNTITSTSLTMTNYPTSRLVWVTSDVTAVEAQINTGVQYTVDLGSITYCAVHSIIPLAFEEV